METHLKWRRGFFSNRCVIFSVDQPVGELKFASFSTKTTASLYDQEYTFLSKGFFKDYTLVYDKENKLLEKINHSGWKQPRTLFEGRPIKWQYENRWKTQWTVFDAKGTHIKYSGTGQKGDIELRTEVPLLVLAGLFVADYYRRAAVAVAVVVVTVLIFGNFGSNF